MVLGDGDPILLQLILSKTKSYYITTKEIFRGMNEKKCIISKYERVCVCVCINVNVFYSFFVKIIVFLVKKNNL